MSALGRILEGIGEHVHEHLVEVLRVYPDVEPFVRVAEGEVDAARGCLVLEGVVEVGDEADDVHAAEVQVHLPLVNLADVHELVDEAEDALGIAVDGVVALLARGIGIARHELLQRTDDERHGCAYLVGYVDEEAHLRLVELFGVDVLHHLLAGTVTLAHVEHACGGKGGGEQDVGGLCPPGGVPCRGHDDGELPDRRVGVIAPCLDAEVVGAGSQVAEGDAVDAGTQVDPRAVVEGVGVADAFGIVELHGGELDAEGVVRVGESDAVGVADGAVDNVAPAGLHARSDGTVMEVEVGDADVGTLVGAADAPRVEEGDASGPAEDELPVTSGEGNPLAELVALQPVAGVEVDEDFVGRGKSGDTEVGADPEVAVAVLLDGGDGVAGQPVGGGVDFHGSGAGRDALESEGGACPEVTLTVLVQGVHDLTREQAVPAEGADEVHRRQVQAAQSVVGAEVELVVGRAEQAVHPGIVEHVARFAVVSSVRGIRQAEDLLRAEVDAEDAAPERADPEVLVTVFGDGVDALHGCALVIVQGEVGATSRLRVEACQSVAVGADPEVAVGVLEEGGDGRRDRLPLPAVRGEVLQAVAVRGDTVDTVVVGAHPEAVVAVLAHCHDAARADGVVRVDLVAQVAEAAAACGHDEDALLEESQPEVPLVVLQDGVHLRLVEVEAYGTDVHVLQSVGRRMVDLHALSVGPDIDSIGCDGTECLHGHPSARFPADADEAVLPFVVAEESVLEAARVDVALFVLTEGGAPHEVIRSVVLPHVVAGIEAEHAAVVRGDPEAPLPVLVHLVDEAAHQVGQVVCSQAVLLRVEDEEVVSRGADEDAPVASLDDGGDVGGQGIALRAEQGDACEAVACAVITLETAEAADEEASVTVLEQDPDVVVCQRVRVAGLMAEDGELGSVVAAQSVLGGYPQDALAVLVDAVEHAARQFPVHGKELAPLGMAHDG
ncbi:unknown [Bacteroides sp. CAG:462]|nr:unknown [Bacteroides sp. CAG:462]